jgi:hypothetical protein
MRTGCRGENLDLRGNKWREAGEHCIMKSFIACTLHQTKEDVIGGACSTDGRNEKCIGIFWLENLKGKDHVEDLGVDGKIIL